MSTPPSSHPAQSGAALFQKYCSHCHSLAPNTHLFGPSLWRIVGRQAGSVPGAHYSKANAAAGFAWTEERLVQYLENPKKYLPGTKKPFKGVKSRGEREEIVGYLQKSAE